MAKMLLEIITRIIAYIWVLMLVCMVAAIPVIIVAAIGKLIGLLWF